MGRFENFVSIVTGAGQGVGAAAAKKLAEEGSTVILVGRTLSKLENVAKEIGSKAIPWEMDVSKAEDWVNLTEYVKENLGELDVLVNNAAIMTYVDILHTSDEDWREIVDINLGSTFYGMKYCHAIMKKGVYRGIVNVASVGALRTGPSTGNDAGYQATKAGVVQLAKHAAYVMAPDCIRVNCVLPLAIMSPMLQHGLDTTPGAYEMMVGWNPLPPHYGTAEEVADAILYLADPKMSRMVSGAALVCDSASLTQ